MEEAPTSTTGTDGAMAGAIDTHTKLSTNPNLKWFLKDSPSIIRELKITPVTINDRVAIF